MRDSTEEIKKDLLLKKSLHLIKTLQEKVKESDQQTKGDIAIVATACRFPGGVKDAEGFWDFLQHGKDGIIEVPVDRWDSRKYYDQDHDSKGTYYVNKGGFLTEDIRKFDPKVFGISPREAQEMDPQQRLLLEMCWEAAENAGFPLGKTEGSNTGVFIGMTGSEYSLIQRLSEDIGPYTATGSAVNIASGRISHIFGFHGPAITLDTACSSSLVAVHLACQSILNGDCDCAFAGGVNVMLSPGNFVVLSKMNALSEDGTCKVFDADANGYVRSEGGGIIVLKKLSKAEKDKDSILAVIKGSAVNQDGFTSGLTVPNGLAQQKLLAKALKNAGVQSEQIDYIEAHGTGTKLGDPIELQALGRVFSEKRKTPLVVGAVKSNVGHLEAAAGMAGLIKVIMMLKHKKIPGNLHLKKPNPRVDLNQLKIIVPTEVMDWKCTEHRRLAGISSFGFSGTNAHIILEEAAESTGQIFQTETEQTVHILALSACDDVSLALAIEQMKKFLSSTSNGAADICYTQNGFRKHFNKRAAFFGRNKEELLIKLTEWKQGSIESNDADGKVAFIFSDVHKSCIFSLKQVKKSQPAFFDCCEQMEGEFNEKEWSIFALQYGIACLLEKWGINGNAVAGQKNGEIAAFYLSEMIDMDIVKGRIEHPEKKMTVNVHNLKRRVAAGSLEGEAIEGNSYIWSKNKESNTNVMEYLYGQGYTTFIEIGRGSSEKLHEKQDVCIFTLDLERDISEGLAKLVIQLYEAGFDIDWNQYYKGCQGSKCSIPNYPFHKKTYWMEFNKEDKSKTPKLSEGLDLKVIASPLDQRQFEICLSTENLPELKDNDNILHVGYYQELLCRAMKILCQTVCYQVEDMNFYQALYFKGSAPKKVYLVFEPEVNKYYKFKVYTQNEKNYEWYMHVDGKVKPLVRETKIADNLSQYDKCREEPEEVIEEEQFYEKIYAHGFKMGASVKWIDKVWYRKDQLIARLKTEKERDIVRHQIKLHPGILDTCAQLFLISGREYIKDDDMFMICHISQYSHVNLRETNETYVYMKIQNTDMEKQTIECDYELFDKNRKQISRANGVRVKIIDRAKSEKLKKEARENQGLEETKGNQDFAKDIMKLDTEERLKKLVNYLLAAVGKLLNIPVEEINVKDSMLNMGMDSLVGLELKKQMEVDTGIQVPMEQILQGPSIEEFSATILHLIEDAGENSFESISFQRQYDLNPDRWIQHSKEKKDVKFRLFCIPYGIKGASLFADWDKNMPLDVEVCPIQFPGKENRISEMPISDMDEAVEALEQVLSTQMDKPFAFYGHSVGALIAYRIAARLQEKNCEEMKYLFVGAFSSPNIVPNPVYEKVMKAFRNFGFETLPEIDQLVNVDPELNKEYESYITKEFNITVNDEVRDLVKPVGFSDFRLVHTYNYDLTEEKLHIPIAAFHGNKDDFVTEEEIIKWSELTDRSFQHYVFPGDHFFIHKEQSQDELLAIILKNILTCV